MKYLGSVLSVSQKYQKCKFSNKMKTTFCKYTFLRHVGVSKCCFPECCFQEGSVCTRSAWTDKAENNILKTTFWKPQHYPAVPFSRMLFAGKRASAPGMRHNDSHPPRSNPRVGAQDPINVKKQKQINWSRFAVHATGPYREPWSRKGLHDRIRVGPHL